MSVPLSWSGQIGGQVLFRAIGILAFASDPPIRTLESPVTFKISFTAVYIATIGHETRTRLRLSKKIKHNRVLAVGVVYSYDL